MGRQAISTKRERDRRAVAGIKKHGFHGADVVAKGRRYTERQAIVLLEEHLAAMDARIAAEVARNTAVVNEAKLEATVHELLGSIKALLTSASGPMLEKLPQFGFPIPKKRGPKTPEVKAAAAVKNRATRAARHTMGKRQRAKIKAT